MKLDKMQVLNVVYQFCDFWVERKTKITALADPSNGDTLYLVARYVALGAPCPMHDEVILFSRRESSKIKVAVAQGFDLLFVYGISIHVSFGISWELCRLSKPKLLNLQ